MRTILAILALLTINLSFANSSWIYDPALKKLTSSEFFDSEQVSLGKWTFVDVTCNANNGLTITQSTKHTGPNSPQTLDFSLPITDAEGNEYKIISFKGGSNKNLFGKAYDNTSDVANKVLRIIFPSSITSFDAGFLGELRACEYYEFKGNYALINSRQFSNSKKLKEIKFHYLPPQVDSWSYTFIKVPEYASRILYPAFLSTAWTNVTSSATGEGGSNSAQYNIKLTQSLIDTYNLIEGFASTPPTGIARLNYYGAVWKYEGFLAPYDDEEPTDKIRIGIMGEPWNLFWAIKDSLPLKYGVHEFDYSNNAIQIQAPKRYIKHNNVLYVLVGYKLHSNPNEIVPYDRHYTFDRPGNYGITYVWKEGLPGLSISIR